MSESVDCEGGRPGMSIPKPGQEVSDLMGWWEKIFGLVESQGWSFDEQSQQVCQSSNP